MSVLDPDLEEKLYDTVEFVRDFLPVLETAVEVALPAAIPVIETIRQGQTALFELLSQLESAHVTDEKKALVQSSLDAWRARVAGG